MLRLIDRGRAIASFAPAAFNVARYRIHGTYVGDDAYDRTTSSWAYSRITR